ncbi:protein IN CHLOROPLAST ATPASE BIOGENESIS, chloroplastic-like isoform X1 [Euphorbia lathyris]|uniref:protein IN CHLOROPLAST ATPASE BIOGENESIS, chloroplastic-like isoform X1 n=1 Tax=Euphorbia lathyris TaxID=212925 RepID=UPI0033134AD9
MKIRLYGAPRATSLFLNRRRPTLRAYSSFPEHTSFVKELAATEPPKHLPHLLRLLKTRGECIISPGLKQGLIPLVIPLAKNSSGAVIGLLRWPTAPAGMEMPVVEVHKHGVWLLAKTVDQFIHRILVEEDAKMTSKCKEELFCAAADAGENLYTMGDFAESKISDLDVYLIKKVGLFPDVLERRAMRHFAKGDHVSALITAEFYTKKEHFPGFGRPFVFNAEVLLKIGRKLEAKDAARGALKSPWWTLGCRYQEVARIAEWEDEQIEYIKERVTDAGRQADLNKGKDPAQIALDEAAFLLDLASVEGTWDESVDQIAACYKEAGLNDIAKFIQHRD